MKMIIGAQIEKPHTKTKKEWLPLREITSGIGKKSGRGFFISYYIFDIFYNECIFPTNI